MFTMLFPIKTVLSIFPELEIIFSRITARLLPCSARDWIRMRIGGRHGGLRRGKKGGQQRPESESPPPVKGTLESKTIFTPFDYLY